ncbi:lasso peptide biosynthesis PqqD family chaperone [Streptomyces alkaliterrae]|uniref:Lasso peptide biosynthesis PqqD family chaperone n=1 Tax=Streptomyces alkaliterrae TaxID=2213162 RepID=A0A5P0YKP0_9ACTN|nr:lasso peptide biosynthesis PqqD family chaperone [Streptomyces alkaliterrae]MBB1252707.1 lasso peptide biosynthesis PqqD family chaperone [Streptomyces alkaliterrae]MBB1258885.1 lasso peptide biosynthesis PqqD family chaperone [Streptomyces alkaliterrae]MQS00866.1 lasso peptide biosynthesis PqqD family chaperone [Streptomyces alkaliterrae]
MTVRLQSHIKVTKVEGGSVILDEQSGQYWQMNSTAATALDILLDKGSVEAAATTLAESYDVDAEQARSDVESLLASLRSASLVVE